jgi:hypothetical protein
MTAFEDLDEDHPQVIVETLKNMNPQYPDPEEGLEDIVVT